ncbi:DUF7059 domain-containing protein [Raineyella fluvialis]|uniref:Methyltransferase n=1 Tax=Raineyella fluvialis TaxID=2662261 RepID=A0A5Q2FFI3_9ACTN|nr:methyltransferase [Raineyella fluvialis]QGF23873.1 methyltransferase [Raineyella fluvialis]
MPTDQPFATDSRRLADALRAAEFTVDPVAERLGPQAWAALGRNTTLAALRALGGADDPQATLLRLFVLQRTVGRAAADRALPGLVDLLIADALVEEVAGRIAATVDIRPYGADESAGIAFDGWAASDHVPGLDGRVNRTRPDFVLPPSPASVTLTQMTIRRPVTRALDLGTGCGVQSLHLAGHAQRVVATDLNPRALRLADLTLRLNGVEDRVELRHGSLYEPVGDERYDLIISNPPYVMSPPQEVGERLTYREGGLPGDSLVEQVIRGAGSRLADGGSLQVLGNWAHVRGQDWTERLHDWIDPTGCDALVLQRELLDPYEYIELWLNDAGLAGSDEYTGRYAQWLDYFDELGIEGVGLGWMSLHNAGHADPSVQIQEWPHSVAQPVGPAFAAQQQGVELARRSDEELLATSWRLVDSVQETYGVPGAADPDHIVLRQRTGFCRAVEADTALAGVLGACDGELPLGVIIRAVAQLLEADAEGLVADLTGRIRPLVVDGFLVA